MLDLQFVDMHYSCDYGVAWTERHMKSIPIISQDSIWICNYIRTNVYLPKFIPHTRNYIPNKTAGTKDGLEENTVTDGQLQHPHTEDESFLKEI